MTKSTVKVSFLVPDIFNPVLGPVTELARHAAHFAEVQVVGPDFGHGICPMYRGQYPYTVVPTPRLYRFPNYFAEARRLADAVTGEVVVAVKAFASTVPVAWWLRRKRGRKMVVYLDEWDGALMAMRPPGERAARWLRNAHHPMDDVYCPWVEKLIPGADAVLSTTTWLSRRFGGEVLPMGVDTEIFQPRPAAERNALRAELGLADRRVIVFGGVVRPHKGIEDILEALALIGDARFALAIVGPLNEHLAALQREARYAPYLLALGPRPKDQMPRHLDLADLVVLPLRDTALARSQMPCKVFEAMAMAKPIVASAVSDLPAVLEGVGRTVPPGDLPALARAIAELLGDPAQAAELGRAARARCLQRYSREQTQAQLQRVFEQVLAS